MVNYCCVLGCRRNSRYSKHLKYYSLPKERERQVAWLKAAGREDLIEKSQNRLAYRFCSRHFPPSSIKNKLLSPDAVPAVCLPGSNYNEDDSDETEVHQDIICNSCYSPILGFRYKCVTCIDYDLCPKCEMIETHPEHYMLRIPKPLKFKLADNLIQKWKRLFKSEHVIVRRNKSSDSDNVDSDSSDDKPIKKYVQHYDSGVDLSEDVKEMIKKEVTRVLSIQPNVEKKSKKNIKKRKVSSVNRKKVGEDIVRSSKRLRRSNDDQEDKIENSNFNATIPEVIFADVNEQLLDVKTEMPTGTETDSDTMTDHPIMQVKLSDDLTELMIEVTSTSTDNNKVTCKYND
ncbi:uncharacterized protein ACR2FA_008724 [Aphomia sociella]